jgi:hypothetical protein
VFKFKRSSALLSAVFSLLGLMSPQSVQGQNTVVNLQTVYSQLAPAGTVCTGSAQTYSPQNLGQVAHQASAFSTAASVTLEIDGNDGINSYRMSNPAVSFNNGVATSYVAIGSGTYAKLFVVITCSAGATFSLTYAGGQTGFTSVNIGPVGGTTVSLGGTLGDVQGIVAQQASAATVLPIIDGALQLPINGNFLNTGIDNFNTGTVSLPAGSAGTFTVDTVPTPTKTGELGIAFEANLADATSTVVAAPWTCAPSLPGGCTGGAPQLSMAYLANIAAGQTFQRTWANSTPAGQDIAAIVLFTGTPTLRQANLASATGTVAFTGNTLANSAIIAALRCSGTTPCSVSGVTDTQGHTWAQVASLTYNNGNQASGIIVWAATTLSTAAADSVTFTLSSGTAAGSEVAEVPGVNTSTLTTPAISLQANSIGTQIVTLDAQFPNQFVCNVTLSTATTTLCQAAGTTINNVAVRSYVTDVQINVTTAGAGSTLQLKDGTGTNCGTGTGNLSAILYSGGTVGLTNLLDFRTPLFTPLQNQICVNQIGATPSTTTVEIHGYFAP